MAAPPPAASGNLLTRTKDSVWSTFVDLILIPIDKGVLSVVPEVGHLSPIILSIGTAFVALVTLNFPLMILAGSTVEAYFAYNALRSISSYSITPILGVADSQLPPDQRKACKSFFQTLTPSRFDYLMSKGLRNDFPNSPLYFICFAAAYCIQSMYFFSEESSELGPQYSNRPYLGIIASAMFIILYTIYLLAFSCDTAFTLVFTVILGLLVGYLICYQNYLLLGKNAVGLLFIPSLARRTGMDYLCVTTNPSAGGVSMGSFINNDPWSKVSVSWKAIPDVSSYIVKFYTTVSATPSNGTLYQTITTGDVRAEMTYPLVASTYYYATVTGVNADKSTTAPIPSAGAIQVTPFSMSPRLTLIPVLSNVSKQVKWDTISGATSYTVAFYSIPKGETNTYYSSSTLLRTVTVNKRNPEVSEYSIRLEEALPTDNSPDKSIFATVVGNTSTMSTRPYYSNVA